MNLLELYMVAVVIGLGLIGSVMLWWFNKEKSKVILRRTIFGLWWPLLLGLTIGLLLGRLAS